MFHMLETSWNEIFYGFITSPVKFELIKLEITPILASPICMATNMGCEVM